MTNRPHHPLWAATVVAVALAGLARPAAAEIRDARSTAWAPYAGLGGKVVWPGAGLEGIWAVRWADTPWLLGGKLTAGYAGTGILLTGGGWGAYRIPLGDGMALQAELSAGLGLMSLSNSIKPMPMATTATPGMGAQMPALPAGVIEPGLRFEWPISHDAAMGLSLSCLVGVPQWQVFPSIGLSIMSVGLP
jgi:hypothetical protein